MQLDPLAALAGRRVGAHLPLAGGMVRAVERARLIGATCLQVFADNPSQWRRRAQPPADLPAFRTALVEADILPLAVHGPYLLNMAGPDETIWQRTVETIAAELRASAAYGAAFLNVHIGSHRGTGTATGTTRIATAVARALEQVPATPGGPLLVLENSAGGGDGMGGPVEELAAILEAIAAVGADTGRVAFCLDTAHAWGAGYEISRPDAVDRLLEAMDAALGTGRIAMVHLNDSKAALGSHVDRHEHIGAGRIGAEGLRHLVLHERLARVPFYLETPGMDDGYDAINMERVRMLIRGERLPDLPAGAGAARGARSRTAPA
jgi:deoxyribonuclease-4